MEANLNDERQDVRDDENSPYVGIPLANIDRLMRKALPAQAKVASNAKDTMQICISEFISFITSEASERVTEDKRKMITGDDIIKAMETLGFENYAGPLRIYLQKYREYEKTQKPAKKPKTKHISAKDTSSE
jgi:nuclear transcription Y subunit beta